MKNKEKTTIEKKRHYKNAMIGLAISTGILGATTLGLGIAYGITQSHASNYSLQLENIYKRNYYDLVDSANNADMKISKLLASSNSTYQAKMLTEVSQEAKDMQQSISALPLSSDNISQSVRFINQMCGYTQTLEDKVAKGGKLDESDLKTLNDMHDSLTEMKVFLNRMSQNMLTGYSILEASERLDGDYDAFTLEFSQIKADDTDYPTMIYDGPFSDSVVNVSVKGLSGKEVSKEQVYKKIDRLFKNIFNLQYQGETEGKFKTYNFQLVNSDETKLYVQATKVGGNILTVSGNVESDEKNIDFAQAKKIALDFAKENGIEDGEVVWSEELQDQCYLNIAPKQDGIILYPDLVKVKVDMEHGTVIGYDAIAYFTNHTNRSLSKGSVTSESAKAKIDSSFQIKNSRIVLAPLEYNRQVVCHEFECERNGATYYIYFNVETGEEENILKVVKTSDGSKLM